MGKKSSIAIYFLIIMLFTSFTTQIHTNAQTTDFIRGDVNCDKIINIKDVTEIQRHCAKIVTLSVEQLFSADYDGDTDININDCTSLQKAIVKIKTETKKILYL